MHGGLAKLDDFGLNLALATFYVMIGGFIVYWGLSWLVDRLDEISQMTLEDVVGASMIVVLIIVVALLI